MKHKIKNMFLENGILNGKRILATVTTLTLLAGTTLSAFASGDGIRSDGTPWLSTGDVSYQNANGNQSSLFAREDLDYLDDRITDLENTTNNGKAEVASAINSYGYHKDSAVDSNASYSDLASAIKTSQQIPTDHTFAGVKPGETDETSGTISAATADNLSLGTAAWVDGELIVGTGADNNSYYDLGEQNSSGNNVSASYRLGAGFMLAYNGHSAGTATWNDLFTITATYNAETKNISVKIDSFNDNYQDKMYGDKRITCDPTNPTIVSISN